MLRGWRKMWLCLLLGMTLCSVQAAGELDWKLNEDGRAFELSGDLVIAVEAGLLAEDDETLQELADAVAMFTGYAPGIRGEKVRGLRTFWIRALLSSSADNEDCRIEIDPWCVHVWAKDGASASMGVKALISIMTWDSEVLTRREVRTWYEHQRPGVECRWLYNIPTGVAFLRSQSGE